MAYVFRLRSGAADTQRVGIQGGSDIPQANKTGIIPIVSTAVSCTSSIAVSSQETRGSETAADPGGSGFAFVGGGVKFGGLVWWARLVACCEGRRA